MSIKKLKALVVNLIGAELANRTGRKQQSFEQEVNIHVCDSCGLETFGTGPSGQLFSSNCVLANDQPGERSFEGWLRAFKWPDPEYAGCFSIVEPFEYCPKCAPDVVKLLSEFNREIYRRRG